MAPPQQSVITAILTDERAMRAFGSTTYPCEVGAVVSFVGMVRDHDGGRGVTELEYVAHPSAADVLQGAAEAVVARHSQITTVRVAHRIGLLVVGEQALLAEVSSAHRTEAFAACSDLVEEVKRVLPIWKRQVFSDATEEWVNSP
jgi:molybdopterin synthase catalytic subunit